MMKDLQISKTLEGLQSVQSNNYQKDMTPIKGKGLKAINNNLQHIWNLGTSQVKIKILTNSEHMLRYNDLNPFQDQNSLINLERNLIFNLRWFRERPVLALQHQ
jgi:hypothetical protein